MESGPPVIARPIHDVEEEVASVVQAVDKLRADGVALEQIAVLYRINARSEPFEEAFAAAGIPYQVRDGAFLRRPGPKSVLQQLKRPPAGSVADVVNGITDALGYDPERATTTPTTRSHARPTSVVSAPSPRSSSSRMTTAQWLHSSRNSGAGSRPSTAAAASTC